MDLGTYIVLAIVVTVLVCVLGFTGYAHFVIDNRDIDKLNRFIPNLKTCDDILEYKNTEADSIKVRLQLSDMYNEQCVKPVFGVAEPSEKQIRDVFAKMDCDELWNYTTAGKIAYAMNPYHSFADDELHYGHCKT